MAFILPLGLLLGSVPLSYALHRVSDVRVRSGALLILQFALLAIPWSIPPAQHFTRFLSALAAVFAFMRVWQVRSGRLPVEAADSISAYCYFFLTIADVVYSTSAEDRRSARRSAWYRAGRAVLKGVLLGALLMLGQALPEMHEIVVVRVYWCLSCAYLATSGGADVLSALVMFIGSHQAQEMFRWPPLADSPRDFWSRRWNLMFRNAVHRLIFVPLRGPERPALIVALVFAYSALVHEYLVFAALGYTGGHMTAFFALHGAATLLHGVVARGWRLPRALAIALHLAWLGLTSPLFFAPLWEIIPSEALGF
jgi:hypothetical protein